MIFFLMKSEDVHIMTAHDEMVSASNNICVENAIGRHALSADWSGNRTVVTLNLRAIV